MLTVLAYSIEPRSSGNWPGALPFGLLTTRRNRLVAGYAKRSTYRLDELSRRGKLKKDRGAAPGVEATLKVHRGFGAASKSGRSQCQRARRDGAVVTGVGAHGTSAREQVSAHELGLDVLG